MPLSRRPVAVAAALLVALLGAGCASTTSEDLAAEDYLRNAQTYVDGGHHDQALQQFRRALQVQPGNRKALLGEAFSLLALGQGEQPSAGGYILAAEEAFARLEPRDLGENEWKAELGRGMTAWRIAELWDRKLQLRIRSASPSGEELQRASIEEAKAERDRRRVAAKRDFEAVLRHGDQPMARDNLVALWHLATVAALDASSPEGYDAALGHFRRFEEQIERSKRLWQESAKREPAAAALYEAKLHSARRQEAELRDCIANIHYKRRDHAASLAELDKVLEIDPRRAAAYYNRGRNREELGQHGLAADDYRRFLQETDLPGDAPQVLEAVERMKACEERTVSGR
jgi:tetratricopeptide (TPR) repeat protein